MIPDSLRAALRPITLVVGHYGSGKTNFSVNLACDLRSEGRDVTLVDLDIVNPYFRASEQRRLLEEHGVHLVAPVFAEAGSSLDVPSLTGGIAPALESAGDERFVVVDVGGDDAGSTALGRFARTVASAGEGYAMLYVANRFRNLVADPGDAYENLREIEAASRLRATGIVNNSHLQDDTDGGVIAQGIAYAEELAVLADLPLACTTVPFGTPQAAIPNAYEVRRLVRTPWE